MQAALVNALLGKNKISGKLPVSIPGVAMLGDGLVVEKQEIKIQKNGTLPGAKIIQVLPGEIGISNKKLNQLLEESVQNKAWPGGVLLAAKDGKIFFKRSIWLPHL